MGIEAERTYIVIASSSLPSSIFELQRGQGITSQPVSKVSGPSGCKPSLQLPTCTPRFEALQKRLLGQENQRASRKSSGPLSRA